MREESDRKSCGTERGSIPLRLFGLAITVLVAFSSCAGVSYYAHIAKGALDLLWGRRSIQKLIDDPESPSELRARLEVASSARNFASEVLLLPENKSYRKYKDLSRAYATWTVVAAPELSLEPVEWCFPVAGCVTYRGYFSPQNAEEFAESLREQGYDVDLGGVRAYSSLGWFADPVLNTFLTLRDYDLAGLIFHELAHQKLYVKGDTAFNEAFATTVESEGIRRWLEMQQSPGLLDEYRVRAKREEEFVALARDARRRLAEVYAAEGSAESKRSEKARVLEHVRSEYLDLKASWGGQALYDGWFDEGLNNARLMSVGVYHDDEPALKALLVGCGMDLSCFYDRALDLSEMTREERSAILGELGSTARSTD